MNEPVSFEESRRELLLRRARELNERIDALRVRVSRGQYDDADLAELASILRSLRQEIAGNDKRLSEVIGISAPTIAQTYSGRSRPKYVNFMKMLYGAQQMLEVEVEGSSLGQSSLPLAISSEEQSRMEESVRIRSGRSNIFLTERDLARVQQLSRDSHSPISTVIGDALDRYISEEAEQSASPTLGPIQGRIQIEDRNDILRYSNAIIVALRETLDYDAKRHHNRPPPILRLDDAGYLAEVGSLVIELGRLNDLLERSSKASVVREEASRFGMHFDKFLGSYADALGKGAAGLTIAGVVAILYRLGVSKELVDTIWEHLKL